MIIFIIYKFYPFFLWKQFKTLPKVFSSSINKTKQMTWKIRETSFEKNELSLIKIKQKLRTWVEKKTA